MGDYDEFEIGGDADPPPQPEPPGPPEQSPHARPGGRRPGWLGWSLASVALVVAGIAVAPASGSMLPAESWGLMAYLDEPLRQEWSVEMNLQPSENAQAVAVIENRVVVTSETVAPNGVARGRTLRGFDARSGAQVWQHEYGPLGCGYPQEVWLCVTGAGPDTEVHRIDVETGDVLPGPCPTRWPRRSTRRI